MSDQTIKFEIVTPERLILKKEIKQITLPTKQGEITILPNHIPLVATLAPGVIEIIDREGEREIMSVAGGFIEVLKDKVVILADAAERVEELDENVLEEARARAEKSIKELRHTDREEFARLSAQIERELARLRAVKRWKNLKR